jgi:hypothetical protein
MVREEEKWSRVLLRSEREVIAAVSPLVGIDEHSWVLAHKEALAAAMALAALGLVFILGLVLVASLGFL